VRVKLFIIDSARYKEYTIALLADDTAARTAEASRIKWIDVDEKTSSARALG